MSHTPGPFVVFNRRFVMQSPSSQYPIARAMRLGGNSEEHMQQAEENAWRIAICLSSCEGLSNADIVSRGVQLKRKK